MGHGTTRLLQEAHVHHREGHFFEAEALYRQVLARNEGNFDALHFLGVALFQQKKYREGADWIRRALALRPEHPNAWNNLGNALQAEGRSEEAMDAYRQAARAQPDYALAHFNLGVLLQAERSLEQALDAYRTAVDCKPDLAQGWVHLGNVLAGLGRLAEAADAYRQALKLRPVWAEVYSNLGVVLGASGRSEAAIDAYFQALRIEPDYHQVKAQLVHQSLQLCDWQHLDARVADIRRLIAADSPIFWPCFALLGMPGLTAEDHRRAAEQLSQLALGGIQAPSPLAAPQEGRRLRLGYLSGDCGEHPNSRLIVRMLELHDRERFEVFAYSYRRDDGSQLRQRAEKAVDEFVDIGPMSDAIAAQRMRADGIDILVDLQGHKKDNRLAVLAHRPAPIQLAYLGYPGTYGMGCIDYLVADRFVVPQDHQRHYTETIAYLPHCYQANDNTRAVPLSPSRADCGLPAEGFVFCCFNQAYKITPPIFDIWCRLLKEVPGSVLWLLGGKLPLQENLRREAGARGIEGSRLVFAEKVPAEQHLARLQCADLALDTLPYGSHTTGSDALWAGIPMVTCVGDTFAGRVGGSLLTALGLPELIAVDLEDYYQLARRLAEDRGAYVLLKGKLAGQKRRSPLFDSERFTRDMEALYLTIGQRNVTPGRNDDLCPDQV